MPVSAGQWFRPDSEPRPSWVHVSKPRSDLKGFIYGMPRGLCSFLDSTSHEGHRKPSRVLIVSCYRGAGTELVSREHLDGQNHRTFRAVTGKIPRSKEQTVQLEGLV